MLGYLALHLGSACSREAMYEALWPDDEPDAVANRFRVALASLRKQLEPPGTPFGSVLDVSESRVVRLRSETVSCDMLEFEALWKAGRRTEAMALAREPLLLDLFDEWAVDAQDRHQLLIDDFVPALSSQSPVMLGPDSKTESISQSTREQSLTHSLPLYLTRFFGRSTETAELMSLISNHRLVTIQAMGGFGKSRLAAETSKALRCECLFVSLANVADRQEFADVLLRSAGTTCNRQSDDWEDDFVKLIAGRSNLLLVLDGAEHLINDVAATVLHLLEATQDLRILVTSRSILNIPGENVLKLRPLKVPTEYDNITAVLENECAGLFMDRAMRIRPDFTLSDRNAQAVFEICNRLEGVPLAIELAASRVSTLSVGQIAQSVRGRIIDLKSNQRGISERHRSLRAVLDSSLELLDPDARALLQRLTLFRKTWTKETLNGLATSENWEEQLEALAASSLVISNSNSETGVMTFQLSETIRDLLIESDPEHQCLARWSSPGNLVANGSFEDDRPNDTWLQAGGGVFPYPFIVPNKWSGVGSCNVNTPNFAAFPNGVPEGTNTAVVGDHTQSGRLTQDIAEVIRPGMLYRLKAHFGNRVGYPGAGRIKLESESGEILLDSGVIEAPEGTFRPVEMRLAIDESSSAIGETLRIVLERADGIQANYDCIELVVETAG